MDKLKKLGFEAATQGGCSVSLSDILIPKKKDEILEGAFKEVEIIQKKLSVRQAENLVKVFKTKKNLLNHFRLFCENTWARIHGPVGFSLVHKVLSRT